MTFMLELSDKSNEFLPTQVKGMLFSFWFNGGKQEDESMWIILLLIENKKHFDMSTHSETIGLKTYIYHWVTVWLK